MKSRQCIASCMISELCRSNAAPRPVIHSYHPGMSTHADPTMARSSSGNHLQLPNHASGAPVHRATSVHSMPEAHTKDTPSGRDQDTPSSGLQDVKRRLQSPLVFSSPCVASNINQTKQAECLSSSMGENMQSPSSSDLRRQLTDPHIKRVKANESDV